MTAPPRMEGPVGRTNMYHRQAESCGGKSADWPPALQGNQHRRQRDAIWLSLLPASFFIALATASVRHLVTSEVVVRSRSASGHTWLAARWDSRCQRLHARGIAQVEIAIEHFCGIYFPSQNGGVGKPAQGNGGDSNDKVLHGSVPFGGLGTAQPCPCPLLADLRVVRCDPRHSGNLIGVSSHPVLRRRVTTDCAGASGCPSSDAWHTWPRLRWDKSVRGAWGH